MAQAHRIKTEPSAIWVGVIRFLKGVLRESGFWLLVVVALGMIGALATFSPEDSAWTHTANTIRPHNLGGVIGAWFADVALYFFGYAAYLLPLGVMYSGWRLFKRGALLDLDAEIVLLRVLGFAVSVTTACGLAALYLRAVMGAVPGDGSAGGLVGMHVSQFLTRAFGWTAGVAFMAALLLAGMTLTAGVSWLTLLDWIGGAILKLLDEVGGLVMAPLRWVWPAAANSGRAPADAPVVDEVAAPPTETVVGRWASALASRLPNRVAGLLGEWRARRAGEASVIPSAPDSAPAAAASPPDAEIEAASAAAGGRHAPRIEPVLNLPPGERKPSSITVASVSSPPAQADWEPPMDMLTLVPTAATAHGAAVRRPMPTAVSPAPSTPPPTPSVQVPWTPGDGFASVSSDNPPSPTPAAVMTPPPVAPDRAALHPLPPLDLLDWPSSKTTGYSRETLEGMSRRVETLFKHFGVAVKVAAAEPGPVITRFGVEPGSGVKGSQISNLSKDLARGLSVTSVRVVEAIPGKSWVGLEIPNQHRETVYLRDVLQAPIYAESAAPLTLALGKDIGGHPVVANLARMPHLLVAGATGSGKSVAINAMLLSLLYKATPSEARLILVGSKMPKLSAYEHIPHLLAPVVTDMRKAAHALRWCVSEMERRYRLMAALKVRNIAGFNRKIADALAAGESVTDPFSAPVGVQALRPLPFIVVVIDDLADMMMVVGKKVEERVARLTQKARAAGIHLILATRRPSVDVITGLIKANIPTRIAFQVSSRADSRAILDQMGAEQLLGQGDMLYLPSGAGLPQRVHGALVDDHEVSRVVAHLRRTGSPDYVDAVLAEPQEER